MVWDAHRLRASLEYASFRLLRSLKPGSYGFSLFRRKWGTRLTASATRLGIDLKNISAGWGQSVNRTAIVPYLAFGLAVLMGLSTDREISDEKGTATQIVEVDQSAQESFHLKTETFAELRDDSAQPIHPPAYKLPASEPPASELLVSLRPVEPSLLEALVEIEPASSSIMEEAARPVLSPADFLPAAVVSEVVFDAMPVFGRTPSGNIIAV